MNVVRLLSNGVLRKTDNTANIFIRLVLSVKANHSLLFPVTSQESVRKGASVRKQKTVPTPK